MKIQNVLYTIRLYVDVLALRKSLPIHSHSFIIQLFYAYKKLAAHMLTCSFVWKYFFFYIQCLQKVPGYRKRRKSCSEIFFCSFNVSSSFKTSVLEFNLQQVKLSLISKAAGIKKLFLSVLIISRVCFLLVYDLCLLQ